MFLSPYYRITPHLRSSSRRPKSFRGRGGERRGGSDESGRGGGGGERKREREIEFLGCILKPVELSGNCREAKSAGGRAWTEFRIYFPFCMPASLPTYFFLYFRSIYISGTTGLFAFHLSNVALWPRITRDHDAGSFMKSSPSYGPHKWF